MSILLFSKIPDEVWIPQLQLRTELHQELTQYFHWGAQIHSELLRYLRLFELKFVIFNENFIKKICL